MEEMDQKTDQTYQEGEKRTFWLSLFSAVGILALLGTILYLSQVSTPNTDFSSPGAQPGIGGGPQMPTGSPTPVPSETPAPTETPTVAPQSYSL